jgi:uncharacterized protein YdaU (DUF1376 family)
MVSHRFYRRYQSLIESGHRGDDLWADPQQYPCTDAGGEMSGRADTWMPLYIGDYLADTSHLDAEQSGAYLHLLMHYWRSGPLLDDELSIVRITKMSRKSWRRSATILRAFFVTGDDGRLHQKRTDLELNRWNAKKLKATEKATKAAQGRWGSDAPSNAPSTEADDAPSNPYAMPFIVTITIT